VAGTQSLLYACAGQVRPLECHLEARHEAVQGGDAGGGAAHHPV
jgi:hypothetical protein